MTSLGVVIDRAVWSLRGGNNIAMRLVLEGMKLQPNNPTFVQMRDAILAADAAVYNGTYNCAIWEAFAARGLGENADSGGNTLGDETENFDVPESCAELQDLPVELLSFEATAARQQINLEWVTASEVNNKGFFVERSTTPNNGFTEIDFVTGRGGNTRTSYQLTDSDVLPNTDYYYRLRQVDFDNTFEYSEIRTAKIDGRGKEYQIQPNPTQGSFEVRWVSALDTPESIQVVDVSGKVVVDYKPEQGAATYLSVDIGHLPNNLYFVKIQSNVELITKKILLQH